MRRGKTIAAACMLALAAIGGHAQERYTVDKVAAVVGNSAILYSELCEAADYLEQEQRAQGYTPDKDPMIQSLEFLLTQKVLYNQALIDSVQISMESVMARTDQYMSMMEEQAGSVAALEEQLGQPSFAIRQRMKERFEEQEYARAMRQEIDGKVTVTPGEVERFYRQHDKDEFPIVPQQYVYAQIVRFPTSSTAAKQRVREQLLDMRERIINGTRFDLLARMYSIDATAMRGGDLGWMPLQAWVQPFADAVEKLQPGQISEVVETEFGFHIIELLEKKGDKYHARHIVLRPVYTPDELAADGRFLDSLAQQIRDGKITFEEAALQYSDDKYSRQNGGVVTNSEQLEQQGTGELPKNKFMREELQNDYPALSQLKVGEISPSFQSYDGYGNVLNKIVKLIAIIPAHTANLSEDYTEIESLALQAKREEEFQKWLNSKIDGLYVRIEPEFRDADFDNKNWVK
ncbi:MAG TPA: peptidylprolyl isomerase [Candidatus Tidjanibacter faecipullorum]|uniref:Peptidylprolyl isomerase n=1 Tax=Candidatus Tidjanibacter faecipullorum TaxID=2838766 RepID=A0A9D2DF45_9BACT|nr:peptidylprolyl isomerase [Candidatus Tidjanibacter faecipullorum]